MNKEICPKECCEYFLFTSTYIFISGCIMFYNKDYISSMVVFALVFTSINFWRNPQFGYRRTIDMTMCKILGVFLLINSINFQEFNRVLYECIIVTFLTYSFIENILWSFNNHQWIIFHLAMHIYTAYFLVFIYYVL